MVDFRYIFLVDEVSAKMVQTLRKEGNEALYVCLFSDKPILVCFGYVLPKNGLSEGNNGIGCLS